MILLDLNPDEASLLAPIRTAVENGNVPYALKSMRNQVFPSSTLSFLHLLEIQGLTEQGLLKDAFSRCQALLATESNPIVSGTQKDSSHFELRLRHAFLKIFFHRSPRQGINTLRTLVNQSTRRSFAAEPIYQTHKALSYDFLARALTLAVGWHALPPSYLSEAKRLQDSAARLFAEQGAYTESVASLIALGQLALQGPNPTPVLAHSVLTHARTQAFEWKLPFKYFEASLLLSETNESYRRLKPAISYEHCLDLARDCPHVLATAMAKLSRGQQLIRASLDGVSLILEALSEYEHYESIRGMYACLSALGAHFYQSGDLSSAESYFNKARDAAERIGAPIFQIANKVALVSLQLPRSDSNAILSMARDIHRSTRSCHPARVISSFTLSNVFAHLSLPSEAEEVGRAAIRMLRKCGPSPTLALAYFFHGNILASTKNWDGAYVFWKKAHALERRYGDTETICQRLQCLSLASVMRALQTRDAEQIENAYFDARRSLTQAQRMLSSLENSIRDKVRAGIDQMIGQLALLCNQPEDGLRSLEVALIRYREQGLTVPLGFTNAQLGLLRYELGKAGDERSLQKAAQHQEEAYRLFAENKMHSLAWRLSFHRALTEYRLAHNSRADTWIYENVRHALLWLTRSSIHLRLARKNADPAQVPSTGSVRLSGTDSAFGVLPNLINDDAKVFDFAIQICVQLLGNWQEALCWMERKARHTSDKAFLEDGALLN